MHDNTVGAVPPPAGVNEYVRDSPAPAGVLQTPGRIEGYDVTRAIAVIGMIMVNARYILFVGRKEPAWFVAIGEFLCGRAAVLFVMLAGVGLALMSRRAILEQQPDKLKRIRIMLLKRSVVLYVLGLLFMNWWRADILHFYGIFLSAGALLLTVSSRRLLGLAFVLLLYAGAAFLIMEGSSIDSSHWPFNIYDNASGFADLLINGSYPVLPWLMFILVGICLGRHEVIAGAALRRKILIWAAAIFIVAELLGRPALPLIIAQAGLLDRNVVESLLMINPFPISPLFALSATGSGAVLLILVLAVARQPALAWIVSVLQNTGKFSLTVYIAHILFFLWADSFILPGISREAYPLLAVSLVLGFCLFTVIFANVWARRFNRGPLEWLLRRLSASMS